MNTFLRFFYEFISIFFDGFVSIFKGIGLGITQIFNFKKYAVILESYKANFTAFEWILVGLSILVVLAIFTFIGILIFLLIRKILRRKEGKLNQEELLEEIDKLNDQVRKLMKEKDELMAMKVSQLGLNPNGEEDPLKEGEGEDEAVDKNSEDIRFPKLISIDKDYENYKMQKYNTNITLAELVDHFKCYSASKLKLYYKDSLLRAFIAGLACGRLIILQGISGTGKTSLAYAWGKFVKRDSCVTSVQPSWRDKTELVGYFNEFTKKFNETEVLAELYIASHDDDVHTVILDEMNIARVEYYFAEMLSILEIPAKDEWIIELVTDSWAKDPKRIREGKLHLPSNVWYIGTINNDDSTFMVTDKVYDRAMPIDINTKVAAFKCREQDALDINASYLEELFIEGVKNNPISEKSLEKVKEMDDYVIEHFRIAFGNRIMKQLNTFVGVYKACGGEEVEGIDYFMARKVLRKFEQLNMMFIRDEIAPFVNYLNKTFGKDTMKECMSFLKILEKSA